jgi:hypothetical protein
MSSAKAIEGSRMGRRAARLIDNALASQALRALSMALPGGRGIYLGVPLLFLTLAPSVRDSGH